MEMRELRVPGLFNPVTASEEEKRTTDREPFYLSHPFPKLRVPWTTLAL
jgi:hypothetical protein